MYIDRSQSNFYNVSVKVQIRMCTYPLRIPFQIFSQISCHFSSTNNVYVVKHTVFNLDLTPPFPSHAHTHYESFNEVIQTLETMGEILKCDHSKESGTFMWAIYYAAKSCSNF